MVEKLKEGYRTEKYNHINANKALAANKKRGSKLELKLQGILDELNIKYIRQYPVGKLLADFYIYNNKIIEVDGDRWHKSIYMIDRIPLAEILKAQKYDKEQDEYYQSKGYQVLHIWGHELRNLEYVKSKILNFISIH